MGFSFGQKRFASASLTTTTCSELSRSASVNPRPRTIGSPDVLKYSASPASIGTYGSPPFSAALFPTNSKRLMKTLGPSGGGMTVGVAGTTPRMVRHRRKMSSPSATSFDVESYCFEGHDTERKER